MDNSYAKVNFDAVEDMNARYGMQDKRTGFAVPPGWSCWRPAATSRETAR
jgi:hypothetical protein